MRTKTEGVKFQNELPVSETQPAATYLLPTLCPLLLTRKMEDEESNHHWRDTRLGF